MKICFLTSWYPSAGRPLEGIFIREHAKAAVRFNDVVVVHCAGQHQGGPWVRMWEETAPGVTEGIPLYRVTYRRSPIPLTSSVIYLWSVHAALSRLRAAGYRPDLIHAQIYEAGFAAAVVGRFSGTPVVVTEHYSAFPRDLLPRRELLKAGVAFSRAARVLPVSRALQDGIERRGLRGRFQIVPNTVDTSLFVPPPVRPPVRGSVRLLFVGELKPVKGIDVLLHALERLEPPEWQVHIVGDGPERGALERLVHTLGLEERVTFHGIVPKADVARMMREADVFVLPSLYETFSCVLLEAMASGLPIVATTAGGIPEVADAGGAVLVPPDDPAALADGLRRALADLGTFSPAAQALRAQRFSHDAVGRRLDAIYRECLAGR